MVSDTRMLPFSATVTCTPAETLWSIVCDNREKGEGEEQEWGERGRERQ